MAKEWYYLYEDQTHGPVRTRDLRELFEQGMISLETPVRKGETAQWVRANRYEGLFVEAEKEWYALLGDRVEGPYSKPELTALEEQGRIQPDTPVRRGKDGEWVSANSFPGLHFQEDASPVLDDSMESVAEDVLVWTPSEKPTEGQSSPPNNESVNAPYRPPPFRPPSQEFGLHNPTSRTSHSSRRWFVAIGVTISVSVIIFAIFLWRLPPNTSAEESFKHRFEYIVSELQPALKEAMTDGELEMGVAVTDPEYSVDSTTSLIAPILGTITFNSIHLTSTDTLQLVHTIKWNATFFWKDNKWSFNECIGVVIYEATDNEYFNQNRVASSKLIGKKFGFHQEDEKHHLILKLFNYEPSQ